MTEKRERFKGEYSASKDGNFRVVDSIGVPHPYCLMPKHVAVASDHHCGFLDEAAIEDAESRGAHCGMRDCNLSYKQHEKALVVLCKEELKAADGMVNSELHAYLCTIKDQATTNGYAGFAFMREEDWHPNA
jgi:hypothetical protein